MLLEVCVDSVESSIQADAGGANRLELCSALSEGGLTPTVGLFKTIKKIIASKPIFVMIRCRRGNDFNYSDAEMDAMLEDIDLFKQLGADGFVFGALTEDFEIDVDNCKKVISKCGIVPVTFHRAFDMTNEKKIKQNVRLIAELGFSRILTSGLEPSAEKGIENIRKIVAYAKECNIKAVPGAGINTDNIEYILRETDCTEFHASARRKFIPLRASRNIAPGGSDDLEPLMICDSEIVKELIKISKIIKQ